MSARRALLDSSHCLLVAEIGNNHQGDLELARQCVEAAARAGADMVKFQKRHMPSLFSPQGLARPYGGKNSFGATYGEHRERLELSVDDMVALKGHAEKLGLTFFASVWDEHSLEEMLSIGVGLLKLPSADLINLPLLRACAATRLPLILSTGMSTLAQIDLAVEIVKSYHDDVVLLHCNSTYPCLPENIGLPVMCRLAERYGLPTGYSGHEIGLGPSVGAAALGARMIERHFTLDKTLPGSDHACSLTPEEFSMLSRMVKEIEAASLITEKIFFAEEREVAGKLRKNFVAAYDLPAGHRLKESDLQLRCTGSGGDEVFSEGHGYIEGCYLLRPISAGQVIRTSDLASVEHAGESLQGGSDV